jgi:alpha-glucoside transport system permease protein
VEAGGGQALTAPPPSVPADGKDSGGWRKYALAVGFLAPASFFLIVWVVYPMAYTIYLSFLDKRQDHFVWFDNYKEIFTSDTLTTALKNNALWVLVVPAFVTAVGLVFAVLVERVRWRVAFKTAVFMPLAISAFAAGITWRIVYIQEPDLGALNAGVKVVHDVVVGGSGALSSASPSTDSLTGTAKGGLTLKDPVHAGDTVLLGLTGVTASEVPDRAKQAVAPAVSSSQVGGVVWRDFKPGGGVPGKVEEGEVGLPGVTIELRDPGGEKLASTKSADDGSFTFDDVSSGEYRVAIGAATFAKPFGGIAWLGPKLVTPSIMMAYIWIWAGFSMVIIGAGLAAMPRDVLEAARTDGATEWQVFRRVTVPLLAPVLTVVFVTMLINVLKIFDIVIAIAPGSVQDDASVLALAMWRTAFSGANDYGVGSAIAVLILVLVIPILLLNIRNFRREA